VAAGKLESVTLTVSKATTALTVAPNEPTVTPAGAGSLTVAEAKVMATTGTMVVKVDKPDFSSQQFISYLSAHKDQDDTFVFVAERTVYAEAFYAGVVATGLTKCFYLDGTAKDLGVGTALFEPATLRGRDAECVGKLHLYTHLCFSKACVEGTLNVSGSYICTLTCVSQKPFTSSDC